MNPRLCAAALVVLLGAAASADEKNPEFNPYKNAKVGDFATYKVATKVGPIAVEGSTTQTVVKKTEKEAEVRVNFTLAGMAQPAQTETIDLTKPFNPANVGGALPAGTKVDVKQLKEGKDKLKAAGKEYNATWTTYEIKAMTKGFEIKGEAKVWMSSDVPLGMLKLELNGEVGGQNGQKIDIVMELTASGNNADKKEP